MTYVLVHGGGFAASCWNPLLAHLDEPAVAVDLPGRGGRPVDDLTTITVGDFVDAVVEEIEGPDLHDVVLVGHSLAGITLPEVAHRIPHRLRRLVFVSTIVPPQGGAVMDELESLSPATAAAAERIGDAVVSDDGTLHPDLGRAMFCNDMDERTTQATLALMVPEAIGVITEPVDLRGLQEPVPRTYVRLLEDASLDLAAQDRMVENLGGTGVVEVVDLDAGHMAMISRPADLAAVLQAHQQ